MIHHAALARLAKTYRTICEEVKKPQNRYEAAATLLGSERPFGQVHLLWQVFGLTEEDDEEEESDDEESDDDDEEQESEDDESDENHKKGNAADNGQEGSDDDDGSDDGSEGTPTSISA